VLVAWTAYLLKRPKVQRFFDPRYWFSELKRFVGEAKDSGWRPKTRYTGTVLIGVLVCLLLVAPAVKLSSSLQSNAGGGGEDVTTEDHPVSTISKSWLFLMLVLLPPTEEVVFRRGILEWLKRRFPEVIAVLGSSLAFGLFHLLNVGTRLFAFIPPFVLGNVFGIVYLREGLGAAALVHVLYNVSFFLMVVLG